MVTKIISGGQTGVDQAALDTAINLDIPHGGWIPKGRKTEAGILPDKYKLNEMPTGSYPKRTAQNILDSDGTLIFSHGRLTGGSALTRDLCIKHARPWLHVDFKITNNIDTSDSISSWIIENSIKVLNVAGSRASKDPEIYALTVTVLKTALGIQG